ncbi:MAG: response regulator [Dysgonamonadaceae bacterium]|nr:response regulator [Dysgonamonadaceae bacterium]
MKHRSIVFYLLILSSFSTVSARNYYFRHYTNEDGLSHNTVYCSIQDKRGFLWLGTKDGLNRFDGHAFKSYRHERENKKSIRSNYVISLHEDPDGLIWIGTNNGLCYYDPQTDDFSDLDDLFLHEGEIGDIKTDFQNNVWIQSFNGLYKYDKVKNTVKYYPAQIYFTPNRICIGSSGDPWFTSAEKALFKYDHRNDTFTRYEILTAQEKKLFSDLLVIVDAREHGLLIGTESLGLRRFDPNTGTTETFLKKDTDGKPIRVRVILPFSDDEFFVGTESGLYLLNIKTGVTLNFRKSLNNPYAIGDNAIYTLTKDMEGGVWIGTYFQGLSYLPNEYASFEKFFDMGPGNNCIRGNAIREITGDKFGNIWIGTEDAGLNKYEPSTGKFRHFAPDEKPISGLNLHGLMISGDSLWIGYYDRGVDVIDISTNKDILHFEAGYGPHDLKTNFIITIYKTKDGRILLGTTSGVYQYLPETKKLKYIDGLASYSFVHCFYEDHKGTMWVATHNNGLFHMTRNGISGYFKHDEKDLTSISSNAVSNVFEDSKNRLWIATRGNGFCLYHPETNNFTRFTIKEGFPSNFIYKILEDARSNLWLTTSNGLIRFNPETKAIKRYSTASGLTNNQFNYNSGYKDKLGKMYFGTINGMISFVPENIRENDFDPQVYITGFQVFNEELDLTDKSGNRESVLFAGKIALPYDKSTFSIDFAALSFTSPDMNEYRYKLDGVDKQWTHLKTYRKAYYTNLAPGEYTFRLKASNGNGEWTDKETTLQIIIKPPFWQTGWAYLCYIILLGTGIYVIMRFYTQKLRFRNQLKIEKMEDLKQQEILRSKIDFFTQIAHEIRTPLTLIKGPLDKIMKSENDTSSNKDNLSIMQKNTNRLLDLTNQLLDFRKAEIENMKLNFTPVDIIELLRETYIRFTPGAKENGLLFELKPDVKHFEAIIDKEAVTKILSNLFTNALKFAKNEIVVSSDMGKDTVLEIRVESDGKQIPLELKEKIFEMFFQNKDNIYETTPKGTGIGLYLGRLLAELHNGRLYLDTGKRTVNSFVLQLPKKQDICIEVKSEKTKTRNKISRKPEIGRSNKTGELLPVVLLVEDEKEMLDYVASELSGLYKVMKAANGKDALEILDNNIVNLIISDISMPVMDGLELCKIVKSDVNYSHIPFILLTARQNMQSQIEGLETGADAYISKPFSTDHLLAQISNLLTGREKLLKTFAQSPLVYSGSIASTKADEEFLKMLNDVILDKLSDPDLNVEYLAAKAGASTSSLYRKMKGICDMSPNEFIRIIRLKRAAELLMESGMSVKEVAYLTGFSAPSYFSLSFQKQFGMKPSDFVKQKQKLLSPHDREFRYS